MGVTLADINACRASWRGPIVVGELPNLVRVKLKLRVPLVHLSRDSLEHIGRRHPEIDDFELPIVSLIVERGMILQEKEKPNFLLAVGKDRDSHRKYVAVMKMTAGNLEVWLTSFHRTTDRQIRKWKRDNILLMPEH